MKKYAVIRDTVLMEDEGRIHLLKVCNSRQEAEAYIKDYTSDGYFSRKDFLVLEEEG